MTDEERQEFSLQAVARSVRYEREGILPPATLTMFACKRLRLCHPSGVVASQ